MSRRIVTWLAIGWIGVLIFLAIVRAAGLAAETIPAVDPARKAEIIQATVQIRMYAPLPEKTADPAYRKYDRGQGLGTVVSWQGSTVIVTHNHWGEILQNAECVDFLDAQGKQLVELTQEQFTRLIRYSDPGTLVLTAPAGLPIAAAPLEADQKLAAGDLVLVTRQDPENGDRVDVLPARIDSFKTYRGQAVFQLSFPGGGKLIHGDSGGGIWFQGKVVGNNWVAIETTWLPWVKTDTSLAATLPAGYLSQ